MSYRLHITLSLAASTYLAMTGLAWAGTITAQGNVTALTNANDLQGIIGTGNFNEANAGQVPLNVYAAQGMTFHTGLLTSILPGCTTPGSASQPQYQTGNNYFPAPIGGGGEATGSYNQFAGVVTFNQVVTQVGLTASRNGTQFLTVWDQNGVMLGQVTWQPANDAAFVGIDTNGVPIGMLSYGNDNLWAGQAYGIGGSTIFSDTWIWGSGTPCESEADCPTTTTPARRRSATSASASTRRIPRAFAPTTVTSAPTTSARPAPASTPTTPTPATTATPAPTWTCAAGVSARARTSRATIRTCARSTRATR
ncbi:MAG: hypothetical protein HC927_01685 [Deltaproteobacteria bacterium]|nr:hypothetical protein [Deltaproteobacteria bacterium]